MGEGVTLHSEHTNLVTPPFAKPGSHAVQAMQVEAAVPVWYLPGSHATHSVSWWLPLFWYVPVVVETQVVKKKQKMKKTKKESD